MQSDRHSDDEELDRLLAGACWPTAQPGQLERLEEHWRRLAVRRRRRRTAALAMAASVLMVVGVFAWRGLREANEEVVAHAKPKALEPAAIDSPLPEPAAVAPAGEPHADGGSKEPRIQPPTNAYCYCEVGARDRSTWQRLAKRSA